MLELRYKPQGATLEAFHQSQARVRLLMGPLGSGKTKACCWEPMRFAINQEPNADGVRYTRGIVVRNTYPDLTTTTIRDWAELYGDLGRITMSNPPEQHWDFDLGDGTRVNAEILFLALDREDDVKKLRGVQATWFWLNEVKEIPKAIIDMADGRIGRYPSGGRGKPTRYGIIGDTNAPDDDHWYHYLAEGIEHERFGVAGPDWEFFRQPGGLIWDGKTVSPNPNAENIQNLPEGYYERQQQAKSLDWIKVNLCNEYGFVQDGKPVWPEYVDSLHVAKHPIQAMPNMPLIAGLDFGLTPAGAILQQTPAGQWRALHETVTDNMGAERFAQLLSRDLQQNFPGMPVMIWGDPAGDQRAQTDEKTVFQVLKANGIDAKPTYTNDFSLRVDVVRAALSRLVAGEPGLLISPSCHMLRKGMAGKYRYKRVKVSGDERYHDKPDKNEWSHVCEALQYGLLGGGEGKAMTRRPASNRPRQRVAITDYNDI